MISLFVRIRQIRLPRDTESTGKYVAVSISDSSLIKTVYLNDTSSSDTVKLSVNDLNSQSLIVAVCDTNTYKVVGTLYIKLKWLPMEHIVSDWFSMATATASGKIMVHLDINPTFRSKPFADPRGFLMTEEYK